MKITPRAMDALVARIEKHFSDASDHVQTLEMYAAAQGADEVQEYHGMMLAWNVEQTFIELCYAFESLGLPLLFAQFTSGFQSLSKNMSAIEYLPYVGAMTSPALDYLSKYFKVLKGDSDPIADDLRRLENILLATPKMLFDRKIQPTTEAEIREVVLGVLSVVFPDTVPEVPIPKVAKTYKPDIGIKSLKCAIEYKFADSVAELKQCIGGILEDVSAYSGTADWTTFFAVIYMTDSFLSPEQISTEFKLANVGSHWRILPVTGKGQRKKKVKAAASAS